MINIVPNLVYPLDPLFGLQCLEKAKEMLNSGLVIGFKSVCAMRLKTLASREPCLLCVLKLLAVLYVHQGVGMCLGNLSWALCLKLHLPPRHSGPGELQLAPHSLENALEEKSPLWQGPPNPGHPQKLLSLPEWKHVPSE